jgi:hypothetical protein
MGAVMEALRKKNIGCCFCHSIILQKVGAIVMQFGAIALHGQLLSQWDAIVYFM